MFYSEVTRMNLLSRNIPILIFGQDNLHHLVSMCNQNVKTTFPRLARIILSTGNAINSNSLKPPLLSANGPVLINPLSAGIFFIKTLETKGFFNLKPS